MKEDEKKLSDKELEKVSGGGFTPYILSGEDFNYGKPEEPKFDPCAERKPHFRE